MKVVLYGASGRAGSRILDELVTRGHSVLAVARKAGTIGARDGVTTAIDDLSDAGRTAEVIKGWDAVISAYGPPPDDVEALIPATEVLIAAVEKSGVSRLLMVGGAGSLEVAPGVTLVESGHLPAEWMGIALAHGRALEMLRASAIDWTSLSPAGYFDPGERTGHFRLGTDNLISDEQGNSRISMEDYAIALVDELETGAHHKARFSIGY